MQKCVCMCDSLLSWRKMKRSVWPGAQREERDTHIESREGITCCVCACAYVRVCVCDTKKRSFFFSFTFSFFLKLTDVNQWTISGHLISITYRLLIMDMLLFL